MPKFIIKHGCCYHPPEENISSTTCQVYSNPHFSSKVSNDFCGVGKSSPDFPNNHKQISWGYLDHETTRENISRTPIINSEENQENIEELILKQLSKKTHENSEKHPENLSLFTIYGNKTRSDASDSDKNIHTRPLSDVSVYRPTTRRIQSAHISSSEKFLDCISTCFWKCSAWCQKID